MHVRLLSTSDDDAKTVTVGKESLEDLLDRPFVLAYRFTRLTESILSAPALCLHLMLTCHLRHLALNTLNFFTVFTFPSIWPLQSDDNLASFKWFDGKPTFISAEALIYPLSV